jgi:stalled ribosome rescue protein Dom34
MTIARVGIWMDHSIANVMEFTIDPIQTKTIKSNFTHEAKEASIRKGEDRMHNKEQREMALYYDKLGEVIKKYEHVILFGPTNAKEELFNYLKEDHHFDHVKIEIVHADKMTDNQQHAFVRSHFSKH